MAEEKKRTKRPTAQKRMIQNEKARTRNRAFRSKIRTSVRRLEDLIAKKEANESKEQLKSVYSLLDKGVKKGLLKLNKAKRTKSRLTARFAAL